MMAKKQNPVFTRREMLGITGMAGCWLAGLTGTASRCGCADCAKTASYRLSRQLLGCDGIACGLDRHQAVGRLLVAGRPHSLREWTLCPLTSISSKTSGLGQKICKAKDIPIFKSVGEAVTLGGKELAVDGVVIVGEHGNYPTNLKGQWLLPRWWIYQQVIRVFEQSKRSVPVFNDKHLSYSWDEAKWMFDKSRELNFPLTGGSSIPVYFRKPEIELDIDTPIKASVVVGGAADEGALFHCVDVLQAFVERRKGGETGVKAVQCIRGPETWKWTERNPWAGKLLESVRTSFDLKPGHFQEISAPNVCIVEYRDGTKAAVYSGRGCGVDLRRRNRRAERPGDYLDAWLARPLLAVSRLERPTALDYRDDGDRKGTIQCGAAAPVHRDRGVQHGIELGERPLLCHRTPHRDAVHEHGLPLDTRTAI